jgi:hypothetical protein
MKLVIRTFFFHILCIIIFAIAYNYNSENFDVLDTNNKTATFLDYLLFSTTIQAGVGFSYLIPISVIGKITIILQQLLMLFTHVITLYIFTL